MLKKIFLYDPAKYIYWLILAIIVKALFFSFSASEKIPAVKTGVMHLTAGDSRSYIEPIENLIKKGSYSPDHRMPGYGAAYLLFRLIFSRVASLNLLALAQLLLSAISVYVLALLAREIFESDKWFYAAFYAYLFSSFVSIFDIYMLTESFAVSSLIFSVFYFARSVKSFSYVSLFMSGLFLTWAVFLRPVALPLVALFLFILLVVWKRDFKFDYSKILKGMAVFLTAFMLIDGAWAARNYKVHGEFIPLQKSVTYPEVERDKLFMGLFLFGQAWGGDLSWWDPKAEINWFGYMDGGENIRRQIKDIRFPECIYTSKFNKQDLLAVKEYVTRSKDVNIVGDERNRYARVAAEKLNEYRDSIKKEKPHVYYIYAPLRLFRKFLFHSGTYNLFSRTYSELTFIELVFKALMSLVYLFVVIGGLLGVLVLFFRNYMINSRLLIACISLYFSVIFPIVLRFCENRYFTLAYPFMLLCALYFSYEVYSAVLDYRKRRLI